MSPDPTAFFSARRLCLAPHRRPRGRGRQLRSLTAWAEAFASFFPDLTQVDRPYCNYKVPVRQEFLEGPHARPRTQRACFSLLLRAGALLAEARPAGLDRVRIGILVPQPDFFGSEICLFVNPDYLASFLGGERVHGRQVTELRAPSLARAWSLAVPAGFSERILCVEDPPDEDGAGYRSLWTLFLG